MKSIYQEDKESSRFGERGNLTSDHPIANPEKAIENQIVMFKVCYPNSILKGKPGDTTSAEDLFYPFPAGSEEHTVANAKRVFNEMLQNGVAARGFCNWLVRNWLPDNNYSG